MNRLPVAKGHGTENDFVLVPDPGAVYDVSADQVAALCDRRAGIGGDGLIRVVRCVDLPEGQGLADEAEWFMDYRNADGSPAEMCGNGARVFARYLMHLGLVDLPDGGMLTIGTRAGLKRVRRQGENLSVDLGPWRIEGGERAAAEGMNATVHCGDDSVGLPGLSVDVGNPHVVVALPDTRRLAAVDLTVVPRVTPEVHGGVNVELVVPARDETGAVVTMRVHERGVGETRSCGTGAVAAVLASRVWAQGPTPSRWRVRVPGGTLEVRVPTDHVLHGEVAELTGPAVLVAEGEIDPRWWAGAIDR
jgi:diaminopimelate epimerase